MTGSQIDINSYTRLLSLLISFVVNNWQTMNNLNSHFQLRQSFILFQYYFFLLSPNREKKTFFCSSFSWVLHIISLYMCMSSSGKKSIFLAVKFNDSLWPVQFQCWVDGLLTVLKNWQSENETSWRFVLGMGNGTLLIV